MKVVHFCMFAPHTCGLYHTTKDLVKAEKGQGIDAHFVDIGNEDGKAVVGNPGSKDGWLVTSDIKVADDADILVRHTCIPNELENAGIPVVIAIHGRPESSLILDEKGTVPVIEGFHNKGQDCRHKAFITFWPEHIDFWSRIVPPKKLHLVPAMVDLMEWRPGGKKFDFGKHNASPNILIADIWREDKTPFDEIMAVAKWIKEECPTAKLHLAAAPMGKGAMLLWHALGREGVLGHVMGLMSNIKEIYEAVDVIVTPHEIATRIVREARATATNVVLSAGLSAWYSSWKVSPQAEKMAARKYAEQHYCLSNAGTAAKKVYESILTPKPKRRKVFLDIGGHLGETVRRFYREVEDARHYEIHTFEPHPECFKTLKQVLGRIKNVEYHGSAVMANSRGPNVLYPGNANDGDGSTTVIGKTTGKVDYTKGMNVTSISVKDLPRMFIRNGLSDYLVLKMNIEGGEYEIMDAMIRHNLLPTFNQIYVQTHAKKLDPNQADSYRRIENDFFNAAKGANVDLFMTEKGMAKFQCSPD